MVTVITAQVAFTIFTAFYVSEVIIETIKDNPLTTFIDEWNDKITRKEIKHHKPKPGEVDVYKDNKFEITTKDGKKKY